MTNQRRIAGHISPGPSPADATCARYRSGAERVRLIVGFCKDLFPRNQQRTGSAVVSAQTSRVSWNGQRSSPMKHLAFRHRMLKPPRSHVPLPRQVCDRTGERNTEHMSGANKQAFRS